jgi:hypothetical protein
LSPKAAGDLLSVFVENQILNNYKSQFRNKIFIYQRYLNLFDEA